MSFTNPEILWLIPAAMILYVAVHLAAASRRKRMLAKILGKEGGNQAAVQLSRSKRFWRQALLLTVMILLFLAAARPYRTTQLRPAEIKGRDLMVLFDVSKSMNASDPAPSRLAHAKLLLTQLAQSQEGSRFGLAAFAGNAYLSCPLTSDPVTFCEYVNELDTDSVPVGGTNLENALNVAERAFKAAESSSRAIILFTDGEELQGDSSRFIRRLKERKIPLFIVGLGDPDAGSPVPEAEGGLVRDASGKIVTSKLNEKSLMKLAQETGGIYLRSTVTDPGLGILEKAIEKLGLSGTEKIRQQIPVEEFPKFLAAALVFFLLYLLLSERPGKTAVKALTLFLCFTSLSATEAPKVAPPVPEEPAAKYNYARNVQKKSPAEAAKLYEELLRKEKLSPELQSRSFHNLGAGVHQETRNRLRNAAAEVQKQQLDGALKLLDEAEKSAAAAEELYARSLAGGNSYVPAAGSNLNRLAKDRELIRQLKKKIEELKKQQQKAKDQTKQARKDQQKQQKQDKQKQQQNKQQNSLKQAQNEVQKLENMSQNLQQKKLEQSAKEAQKELKEAEKAQAQQQHSQAQKHIEKALKALGGEEKTQKQPEKQNQPRGQGKGEKKQAPKLEAKPEVKEPKPDPKGGSEQLLQLLGDEEKNLREALRRKNKTRRPKVEKDW